uniref:Uncharacterized protein n=1 Tax=Rhizophora mucronata TaxID=61149 RepID=A0A2P2QE60_RHIMU
MKFDNCKKEFSVETCCRTSDSFESRKLKQINYLIFVIKKEI